MTALRRINVRSFGGLAALVALALGSPAPAQDKDAPIDVTAAPPPSAETVGPSQLRNFNLQGTVTRPSEGPAAAPNQTATTAPATPRPNEAVPSEAAAPAVRDTSSRPAVLPSLTPSSSGQPDAGRRATISPDPVTPSQPLEVNIGPAAQPAFSDGIVAGTEGDSPASPVSWPWIAALLALLAGGAFVGWSRHNRRLRYGDAGRMAFAGPAADAGTEPLASPPVRPRADPVPPRGGAPSPRPDPVPSPAGRPAPAKPVDDGLVVSTRFKPELNVSFVPDRVMVTATDAVLQFDVMIANSGSAPARDVLVEAKMFTAHPGQDQEIAAFFHRPVASGDRIPAIAPLGKLSLKSMVKIPLDELRSFEAGGRRLFVPLVGFNVLFRSGNGEGQASASFLVGRGNESDEKLAPFRLDLGPRVFRGLSARPHSLGLQPA